MPDRVEILISEWLDFANEDLETAAYILKGEYLYNRSICYHCQQAAEKYLKAYIIYLDLPLIKTHNIALLCEKIKEIDNNIMDIYNDATELTQYITGARYPDDFDQLTDSDSKAAYQIAFSVKEFVTGKIIFKK